MVTFGFQKGTYAEDSSSICSITDVYLKYKPKKMHSLAYKLLTLKLRNMNCNEMHLQANETSKQTK